VVGRVGRLAVFRTQTGYMECQQPSGKAISPSTYALGRADLTPERVVVRSRSLEGGALTLDRRTGRGPGGSSPKVTRLRCSVYVGDRPVCGIGGGRDGERRRVCHHIVTSPARSQPNLRRRGLADYLFGQTPRRELVGVAKLKTTKECHDRRRVRSCPQYEAGRQKILSKNSPADV
jgi:hypothetical protein